MAPLNHMSLRKHLYWLVGILATIGTLVFSEGTLVVTTKYFGVARATLFRVAFTIPLSWIVIYLATHVSVSHRFTEWLSRKEERLSKRARTAVNGGKCVAVLNAAVFLGPILASVLMLMLGLRPRRVYLYAVPCAIFGALVWCAFYGGVLNQIARFFA